MARLSLHRAQTPPRFLGGQTGWGVPVSKFRRRDVLLGCSAIALSGFAADGAPARPALTTRYGFNDEQVPWRLFERGAREAAQRSRPIFMLAHATWCLHCLSYRALFFEKKVVEKLKAFVPILIDVDAQPDVSNAFAPTGNYVPRTMFLDSRARLRRDLHLGYAEFEYFVDYLDGPKDLLRLLDLAEKRFS